jgi:hypothetical protein
MEMNMPDTNDKIGRGKPSDELQVGIFWMILTATGKAQEKRPVRDAFLEPFIA